MIHLHYKDTLHKETKVADTILITEQDLGTWFSVDGKAIKNQEQLDMAIIALAGLHGYKPIRQNQLDALNQKIQNTDESERADSDLVMALTMMSDSCLQYLNHHLPTGYKFDFAGLAYDNFILRKSKSHKREESSA
jgi:hypothetical protein